MDMGAAEAPTGNARSSSHPIGTHHRQPSLVIPLESRAVRLALVVATLAGALWAGKAIIGRVVSVHLAEQATTVAELEQALAWDPGNPDLHVRLAAAYQTLIEGPDLGKAQHHLETALRLRPTHGGTWFRLAVLADRRGDQARARQVLETALRYDPHNVLIRWETALLVLRWGERGVALEHLRYVLAADPERREIAFHLARSLLGEGEHVASLLPSDVEPLTELLRVGINRRDLPLARAAWDRRTGLTPPIPSDIQRQYVELLIRQGEAAEARRLWSALIPNGRPPTAQAQPIWNGSFEADKLLGWGFDWQVERVWGVEVNLDRMIAAEGRQSLRLVFTSGPTLDYAGVFQVVPVEPGRAYRLRALAKALGLRTRSGVKLQVVIAEGGQVLGETAAVSDTTPDWVPLEAVVRIPDQVSVVRVRVRREKSLPYDGELKGKVWLDAVSLTPLSPQGRS